MPPSRFLPTTRPARCIFTTAPACRPIAGNMTAALADFAEAQKLNPDSTANPELPLHHLHRAWGNSTKRSADCNVVLAKSPKSIYTLTSRGHAYLGKGDLDAALNDYNEALKINPNYIRAHAGRGQLFEKRNDLAAARADYRSASADADQVRRDRHRHRAPSCQGTPGRADGGSSGAARCSIRQAGAGKSRSAGAAVRPAQGRADRRQRRLQERAAARQSAARCQADRRHAARTRLCDRDAGARSHPRQVLRRPARRSAPRPKRPIGRWSIMPATAWRSAASII